MHTTIDGAAPVCSIVDQAKVLLIAEYKSYMSSPFKFTLLELSGEHTVYKKQVNVISSNILEGRGQGEVMVDSCRVHIHGMVTSCHL